jgi:hypothetical protein
MRRKRQRVVQRSASFVAFLQEDCCVGALLSSRFLSSQNGRWGATKQAACQQGLRRMTLCVGGVNGEDQSVFYSRKYKKQGVNSHAFVHKSLFLMRPMIVVAINTYVFFF